VKEFEVPRAGSRSERPGRVVRKGEDAVVLEEEIPLLGEEE
jgi:hypothetical protein